MKNLNAIPSETRRDDAKTWIHTAVLRIADGTGYASATILRLARMRAGLRGSMADALTGWGRELGRPVDPPGGRAPGGRR